VYLNTSGAIIRDPEQLSRIRSLAIPPAWQDVWICPQPDGHIQATGFDAKGRKQYRYHARWSEVRNETKFGRMLAFGHALPTLRRRIEQDLAARICRGRSCSNTSMKTASCARWTPTM
jgi:DNA topoisomerase-1